ncbi:MAG TPA: SsrA-binding protein SmpB [Spirochaetes bacterium]|nr:SsrA-binding protein SmpB [Spirochaetota bacterium]
MSKKNDEIRPILVNKKAFYDFDISQKVEAGISLKGTEVKSIKSGKISITDGFGIITNGEFFLKNVHVSKYPFGNRINHDPLRTRKLLLHKSEIIKLGVKIKEKGFTFVPLKVYEKKGVIKIEMGLAKGKRVYNKKDDIRKKDEMRDLKRNFKLSNLSGKLK